MPPRATRRPTFAVLLLVAAFLGESAWAATVTVDTDLGFNPTDSTTFVQQALNGTADTIVLRNTGSPWIVRPLFLTRSNVTLRLEPGAVLQAKSGGFPNASDCLLTVALCSNITISGYGATLRMLNGSDGAYATGESRHCLALRAVDTVLVEGLDLREAGGDGLYLSGGWSGTDPVAATHVTVQDCVMDANRRQGVSVISAEHLLIQRCAMINTGTVNPTPPMAGIDFEPDTADQRMRDCTLRACLFAGNMGTMGGSGISTYFGTLDGTSQPVDITIDGCRITVPAGSGDAVKLQGPPAAGPATTYVMTGCLMEDIPGSALSLSPGLTNTTCTFTGCVLRNTFTAIPSTWPGTPIYIEGETANFEAYGNLAFADCLVVDGRNRPFIRSYEGRAFMTPPLGPTHAEHVTGSITVINPNAGGRVWNLDYANDLNLTLTVNGLASTSLPMVSITASPTTLVEGGAGGMVTVSRAVATAFPLAVGLAWGGTAVNRLDYGFQPGFVIIPAGALSATATCLPRSDGISEGAETVTVSIVDRPSDYAGGGALATMTIVDPGTNAAPQVTTAATATPAQLTLP